MTMRQVTASHVSASLLAAFVLGQGAAYACVAPDNCAPWMAPTYAPVETPSDNAESTAATPAPGAPLRLNAPAKKTQANQAKKREPRRPVVETAKTEPAPVELPRPRPDAGDAWPAAAFAMDPAAAPQQQPPEPPVPTAEANENNDADRTTDNVRVVSADQLNEIDLAAPPAETTGRAELAAAPVMAARTADVPQSLPTSWIAGLVFAFGGVAAAASALFIRQTRA